MRRGIQPVADRDALQQGRLDTEVAAHVEHGDGRRDQVGMPNSRREVGREERPGPFRRDILAVRRRPAQQGTQACPKDPVELSIVSEYRRQSMCAPPPGAVPDPLEALSKAAARDRMERSGVATRDSAPPLMRDWRARGLPGAHGGWEWTQQASNIPI